MIESKNRCLVIAADETSKKTISDTLKSDSLKVSFTSKSKNIRSSIKNDVKVVLIGADSIETDLFDLIESIKSCAPLVPVIIMSSSKEFALAKRLVTHGVYDLLVEPLSKRDLKISVKGAIKENFERTNDARLLKLARQRASDILLLKEIAESTVKKTSIKSLLERIIDMIADLLDVSVVSIMMLNKKRSVLTINAYKGPRKKFIKGVRIKMGEGVSGFVAKTGDPLLINNITKNEQFAQSNWSQSYANASLLTVPMKIDEEVIGVLNVNNKLNSSEFNENDLNILMTVSNQVAMAIENCMLYESIKEKAKKLEKSNKMFADLSNAKSLLLCNLSHELRTPLTSVIGYLELLRSFSDQDTEEEREKFLSIIHNESLAIAQLIDKILNFFSLDTNKMEWDIAPLSLNRVVEEVIDKFQHKIKKNGIKFTYINSKQNVVVRADYKMLTTAIEQLFDNAIKFNDERSRLSLRIEKVREKKHEVAKVSIFNTGARIKRSESKKIFEDFYQPGSIMTEKPQGLGLGLATTRSILAKINGSVKLDQSDSQGNTFVCTIPLAEEKIK